MTQQGMPNPIELYEGAVGYMRPILAGIQSQQLTSPTPCTDWNVQQLIIHNIKVAQWVNSMFTGGEGADPFTVGDPLPSEGAEAAFMAAANDVLTAIKVPGMLEKVLETPFGEMPAGNFLMMPFGDILIHKWDLAKATDQDTGMDSSMADACFKAMEPMADGGRQSGFFGAAVVVAANASDRDKLLGLTGRTP